jgi:hypothetical protein
MASNRTKVLKHQRPLDAVPVKVLSPEERLGLRACLPGHVSQQAADAACDELERAFAIYRSGLARCALTPTKDALSSAQCTSLTF